MSPTLSRRELLLCLAAAGTSASVASIAQSAAASAPGWPNRPLRIVVPYGPGGTTDMITRLLAPELQRLLGQPVVVENKAGADGNIGAAEVAKASDSHTLLMGTVGTHAVNPVLSRRLPYDPVKDFAPISLIAAVPLVLVINPAIAAVQGIRSVADLVRVAQAQPGRLHIASGGNGNPTHLAGELFKRLTQTDMLHFPYRTAAPAQQDVVAGNMDLMFDALPAALPQIRSGKLLALAVSSAQRSPSLPDLPTVEEAGGPALKGFEASVWFGLMAPSTQSPDQVARLQRDTAAVLASPAMRERFVAQGVQTTATSSADFAALITTETAKWARVVRLSGVKVDR